MTPEQITSEALAVLKWIDVWAREASGDGRYYVFAFDSPAGIKLRHVLSHVRSFADDGNQQPSGVRGDPVVPGTVNADSATEVLATKRVEEP